MSDTASKRHYHLRAAQNGETRTATHAGRDYLVVPLIVMVEGVVHAVNAPTPELVLAEEFAVAFPSWNGRPVMMNHPDVDGVKVSANSPEVLEASCFGLCFNTAVNGNRLEMEAWLDIVRAAELGGEAQNVIDRASKGDPLEVSVGIFTVAEKKAGVYGTKRYAAIWRRITPDHLAILPEGVVGACSNAMGCGTRAASGMYLVTAEGIEQVKNMSTEAPQRRSLRERLRDLVSDTFRANLKGWSDTDIRDTLRQALKKIEPAYVWVEAVFPDGTDAIPTPHVIYCIEMAESGYTIKMFRRDYSMAENGAVTFGDARVEVEPVLYFEPVTAEGAAPRTASSPCSCGGNKPTTAAAPQPEGASELEKKTRVTALAANPHSPIKEEAALMALSDAGLTALETHVAEAATKAAQPAAPATPAAPVPTTAAATPAAPAAQAQAQAAPQTEAEWLASAPKVIQDRFASMNVADDNEKNRLIAGLKTAQSEYKPEELQKMTLADVQRIARAVKMPDAAIDYSGRSPRVAAVAGGGDDVYANPPDGYAKAFEKKDGVK